MQTMTPAELRDFLSFGTRTAKVATVRSNGYPHVAPVWFVLEGNELVFTTGKASVKGKNLLRDAHVMISVDDERWPFAFVLVESSAIVQELSPKDLLPWTTKLAARYVAEGQADEYGKRNATEGELLIRVPLTKVIARKGIAE
jgi:PPOX class probable F420-dependent enzyme